MEQNPTTGPMQNDDAGPRKTMAELEAHAKELVRKKWLEENDLEMQEVKKKETMQEAIRTLRRPGLFKVQTARETLEEAKNKPIPKMLFDEFWFEGEICILFADTNVGKSILAVQIADSISKGIPIQGFEMEAKKQRVLYFDFELSDKQFQGRCTNEYDDSYLFDDNLLRGTIDPDDIIPDGIDPNEYLKFCLADEIEWTQVKVLIIDNITYLRDETEKARDALPLMKQLKVLKEKYDLSILILAHTPKRDPAKPLHKNDLQGSKMLSNFCDSSFAIGESTREKGMRYLKQIKVRNKEFRYDSEKVILCKIDKPLNFVQFEFVGYDYESNHLKQFSKEDKEELIEEVKKMSAHGFSQRDIAAELGLSLSKVNRSLNS